MNVLVNLALIGYLPVALVLFALLKPRAAFLWTVLVGWLFLPVASIKIPVLADYGKASAPAYAVLLGTLVFHPRLLLEYRPRWFDLPMVFWTVWQVVPSVANGHGYYDGLHQVMNFFGGWSLTYFLARCYFTRPEHLREVAVAVVAAGLVYVPFFLFELRMSPSLHLWVYGYYAAPFFDMWRLGGYRPIVFLQHGLATSFMMCAAAFVVAWMWWHRRTTLRGLRDGSAVRGGGTWVEPVHRICGMPIGWAVAALVPVAVLTRSAGALMIFAMLVGVMVLSRAGRWKWVLLVPGLMMPAYVGGRLFDLTDGRWMIDVSNMIFSAEHGRDGSLDARLNQEDANLALVWQKPWTGWSNWSHGQDQLWLLLARNTGMPSIAAWLLTFSMPLVLCLRADLRKRPDLLVFGVPLGLVLVGWTIDGLFNGMFNPLWVISAAAVMTAATSPMQAPAKAAARPARASAEPRPTVRPPIGALGATRRP